MRPPTRQLGMCECPSGTLWMFRGYTCTESWLVHLFPVTFPDTPHASDHSAYLLSHKYPKPSAFGEADLRFIVLCTHLAALQMNPFLAANLGVSVSWLAMYWAKWTWLGNTPWGNGWFQVWGTGCIRWAWNNLFCRRQVSTQRGVGSCQKDTGTSLEGSHWAELGQPEDQKEQWLEMIKTY